MTSILHRLSGLFLFLLIPFLVLILQMSLRSEDDFSSLSSALNHTASRFILFVVLWAAMHHILAGIRHLFLDVDLGVSRYTARVSAWVVNLLAFLMALVFSWGCL